MSKKNWFVVDPEGLRKSSSHRRKSFIVYELWQNAVDTNTKRVDIELEPAEGKPLVEITVRDEDPEGFKDLAHAYTLFAESEKKSDPEKRGFMNLGEKLVLAHRKRAEIRSTTGTVIFEEGGRRNSAKKLGKGSEFWGLVHMTRAELDEVMEDLQRLIPPKGVETYINGKLLQRRTPLATFEAQLQTRIADAEGAMRPTVRKTRVDVYMPTYGERGAIYEKGIPVVETGDSFHVDVQQKVPVTMDRENVAPAFLRDLRALVLNHTAILLSPDDARSNWVRQAASSDKVEHEAFKQVIELRFGDKAVAADPSDREGENIAKGKGYVVVHGGSMSAGEWENARRFEVLPPAGQVTPSPKPFSDGGKPLEIIPHHDWTPGMRWFSQLATRLYLEVSGHQNLRFINFTKDRDWGFTGTWDRETKALIVNVAKLPVEAMKVTHEQLDFLIHEFAHDDGDHLERKFDDACTRIGARFAMLALTTPEMFK